MNREDRITLRRLGTYIFRYKKDLLIIGGTLVITMVIGFFQPLIVKCITDEGMQQSNLPLLVRAVCCLFASVVINILNNLFQSHLFVSVHNQSYIYLFHEVFIKLLHTKKSYFDDRNNTEVLSFLQTDVSQVTSLTDRYVVTCVGYLFKIVSGLLGLLLIDWKMTILVVLMIPIKYFLVRNLAGQRKEAMNEFIEQNRDFSRWFGDTINGIDEIKLWNLFKSRDDTFRRIQKKLLSIEKRGVMIDSYNVACESTLEWMVTIGLYLLGGILVCSGDLSIGDVFAFLSFSGYVTGPISALLNLKVYLARVVPSAKRLFSFLDMESEAGTGGREMEKKCGEICFSEVRFKYEGEKEVLRNINLIVAPGEKIAIIGPNGSGKSTILNLLLRFYDPDGGTITYDGQCINEISINDYRENFSVVSQNPYLFLGSIVDNINVDCEADYSKVKKAMIDSGVSKFINGMPDKELTLIGRNGAKLSGGEKQKIAVARALLKDSPIIILDEAMSALDVESDEYIHKLILNEMKERTVILITHNNRHLYGLDRVYQLRDGQLYEIPSVEKESL